MLPAAGGVDLGDDMEAEADQPTALDGEQKDGAMKNISPGLWLTAQPAMRQLEMSTLLQLHCQSYSRFRPVIRRQWSELLTHTLTWIDSRRCMNLVYEAEWQMLTQLFSREDINLIHM